MQISGVRAALVVAWLQLTVVLFTGCAAADNVAEAGPENGSNLLAIHLVGQMTAPWPPTNQAQLLAVKPHLRPVLAGSDFVSFDARNHTFVLRRDTAKRLAHEIWSSARKNSPGSTGDSPPPIPGGQIELLPVPVSGVPFVLTISGEPIYGGSFYSMFSSMSFDGPVILADDYAMKSNAPADATFAYRIEPGYPGGRNSPDPRSDERIVAAVEKLFKKNK